MPERTGRGRRLGEVVGEKISRTHSAARGKDGGKFTGEVDSGSEWWIWTDAIGKGWCGRLEGKVVDCGGGAGLLVT